MSIHSFVTPVNEGGLEGNIEILRYLHTTTNSEISARLDILLIKTSFQVAVSGLLMACDKVEKSSAKITATCYMRLDGLECPAVRDEIILMAKYVTELAPKLSAAGFFQLNQYFMSTIFSSLMTYLIILIQFNLSLR
ncbi:hypothetical protein NQ318_016714 [Aromia moschata]|uniref:Uncharacterized protein n=1 Tax=Aromia moschata TaxID=1265417 RepID=A0AAV8XIC3_9CUCU|nr:hypothetical protein NQ318_016714 [Aromia moschata]